MNVLLKEVKEDSIFKDMRREKQYLSNQEGFVIFTKYDIRRTCLVWR